MKDAAASYAVPADLGPVQRYLIGGAKKSVVPLLVIVALTALVVPVPTWALDGLIAVNLAASLVLLVVALQVAEAVKFSALPTLILLTTLLRLSLNVASTRLILREGEAGDIISTFGEFVVGGNLVVGVVVFVVLLVIQFVVISKGAERATDVGARFFLDGMPFKQQAVEGDLQTCRTANDADGAARALERRFGLDVEARFYGALEGAMKFIKGDAVAGLVIAAVNIGAGVLLGVTADGLSAGEAAEKYALLTIGDGLVSQIPALLVSAAAASLVMRVRAKEHGHSDAATDIAEQLFCAPAAIGFVGAVLLGVAATSDFTGFPRVPFLALGLGATAFWFVRRGKPAPTSSANPTNSGKTEAAAGAGKSSAPGAVAPPPMRLVVPPALSALLIERFAGFRVADGLCRDEVLKAYGREPLGLEARLAQAWYETSGNLGFYIPTIGPEFRASGGGGPFVRYSLEYHGGVVARGALRLDRALIARAPDPAAALALQSAETAPLPGTWGDCPAGPLDFRHESFFGRKPADVVLDHLETTLLFRAADFVTPMHAQLVLEAARTPKTLGDGGGAAWIAEATEALRMCVRDQLFPTTQMRDRIADALVRARARRDSASRDAKDPERLYAVLRREFLAVMLARYAGPTGALAAYRIDPGLLNRLGAGQGALLRDAVRASIRPAHHLAAYLATSSHKNQPPMITRQAGLPVIVVRDETTRRLVQSALGARFPGVMVVDDEELASVPEPEMWTGRIEMPET